MLASAADIALRGRNFLRVSDLSPLEIGTVLAVASHLKGGRGADQLPLLRGRTLGMLFEKPSLRTRVSFEVGVFELGGHPTYLIATDLNKDGRLDLAITEQDAVDVRVFINARNGR